MASTGGSDSNGCAESGMQDGRKRKKKSQSVEGEMISASTSERTSEKSKPAEGEEANEWDGEYFEQCHDKKCRKWRKITAEDKNRYLLGGGAEALYCVILPDPNNSKRSTTCKEPCDWCEGDVCKCICTKCNKAGIKCVCVCLGCSYTKCCCKYIRDSPYFSI
jgi:hypothetical protein